MSENEANKNELDLKALEAFVVENANLERLEALLGRFNIFEVIGVVQQELRHSDLLAFLLDPQGNHGLDDAFVKRLLQRVLATADGTSVPLTPMDLELWNLDRIEVLREWQHIDILLRLDDGSHRLAIIIENKIGTGEHSDQLRRYHRIVEQHYPGWQVFGLYLTPSGDTPSDEETYLPVDYGTVYDVIDSLIGNQGLALNPDVKTLMTHYTEMLRRHIVDDSEIAQLCSQIYRSTGGPLISSTSIAQTHK